MYRTRIVSLPVILAAVGFMPAGAQETAGQLQDFIARAIANNKALAATRLRVAEARGLLRQAGVRPAPSLAVSGVTGRMLGSPGEEQYSASYNYILETGGKRGRRVEAAEHVVRLAEAELRDRERQLAFEVASRYLDGFTEQQRVQTLDRIVEVNRESLRLTEVRVKEGDVPKLDAQLLAVDLNRVQAERTAATGRLASALGQLARLVGFVMVSGPLEQPPVYAGPLSTDLAGKAHGLRPDLLAARVAEQQSQAELRLARAQGLPDLTLSAEYSREYERFDPLGLNSSGLPVALRDRDDTVSVGISIPLGTRRRNVGNVQAAEARAEAARLRREFIEVSVPAEVNAALRQLESARSAAALLSQGVLDQAQKNLEVIRQAYQLGQLRLLDVLAEQRRLLDTQLGFVETRIGLYRAQAELERAIGGSLQ